MIKKAQWFCAIFPLIALIFFISLAIHARVGLGHWPEPMFEDYSTPIFDAHLKFVDTIFVISGWWMIGIYVLLSTINHKEFKIKKFGIHASTYLLSWLIVFVAWGADKTEFVSWYLD